MPKIYSHVLGFTEGACTINTVFHFKYQFEQNRIIFENILQSILLFMFFVARLLRDQLISCFRHFWTNCRRVAPAPVPEVPLQNSVRIPTTALTLKKRIIMYVMCTYFRTCTVRTCMRRLNCKNSTQ